MARLQKIQVTILASEWGSSNGVLSTTIREFAIQLAKHDVNVNLFMPKCSETDKEAALKKYGISIFTANRLIGFKELDWLSVPPDNLRMDVIVGHGVELGRQAQTICNLRKCKWVQVVHSDPEFERNRKFNEALIKLCEMADFIVAVGPKLTEAFRKYLCRCKRYEDVFDFTPGVFADFACVQQVSYNRENCSILVFGRGDAEDYELKDFDIVGRSVASLPDTHLIFIGAHETKEMTKTHFENLSIPSNRQRVRSHLEGQDYLEQLFCEADLLLMPSRTEGFGMMGLMALSAGLPVIVNKNSGFGEALKSIPFGSMFFIDSEDDRRWKMAIEDVWKKDRKLRLLEIEEVRRYYGERYSWRQQCEWLIEKMRKLCDGTSSESEVTEETVEAMELKLNDDFTGSSSEPETTAEGMGGKKRKRKKNFTGHSLRVPSKRKNGIQKKETAQVHEIQQTFLKRWLQRKPKSQFLVSKRRMKKGMMLTREKSAKKKKKNINSRSMECQQRKKKKKDRESVEAVGRSC